MSKEEVWLRTFIAVLTPVDKHDRYDLISYPDRGLKRAIEIADKAHDAYTDRFE